MSFTYLLSTLPLILTDKPFHAEGCDSNVRTCSACCSIQIVRPMFPITDSLQVKVLKYQMGGKRREVKKIEKVEARRVTFAKRRKGLLKKAQELSVLCEADVGLIIFSATGKLSDYSNTNMRMILKKYYESIGENLSNEQSYIENENQDLRRVRHEMEGIEYTLSHMDGENLEGIRIEELKELERKLEVGLYQIRATKEKQIEEENNRLHLEISKLQKSSTVEILMIEPLGTRDYPQSSEARHDSFTIMSEHTAIIQHSDISETSAELRLSI